MLESKTAKLFPKLLAVAIAVAAVLSLPACLLDGERAVNRDQADNASAEATGSPNTLQVGRLSVDYPDELEAGKLRDSLMTTGARTFKKKSAVLATGDSSVYFTIEQYSGVSYDEAWERALSEPEGVQEASGELELIWGVPKDTFDGAVFEEPQKICLNGSDAFVCRLKKGTSNSVRYFVRIDEDSVGLVSTGYTDEQYVNRSDVYDGVLSSIKVS